MKTINFNTENTKEFAQAYNEAVKDGKDSFMFQDGEFLTKYAYYLLQHLFNEKMASGEFNQEKQFLPPLKKGDKIDVFKNGKLWCVNVLVNEILGDKLKFFNQGQDDHVWVDKKDCKISKGYGQK